jgi:hypothetical protein
MADATIVSVVNTPSDQIANKTLANTWSATQTFNGGIIKKITSITDTYTILVSDISIVCNKATSFTVTLPTAVVGQIFDIFNIGVGAVTIEGAASDTIDGELNQIIKQNEAITITCYVANKWKII